jgi:hypothetical protein
MLTPVTLPPGPVRQPDRHDDQPPATAGSDDPEYERIHSSTDRDLSRFDDTRKPLDVVTEHLATREERASARAPTRPVSCDPARPQHPRIPRLSQLAPGCRSTRRQVSTMAVTRTGTTAPRPKGYPLGDFLVPAEAAVAAAACLQLCEDGEDPTYREKWDERNGWSPLLGGGCSVWPSSGSPVMAWPWHGSPGRRRSRSRLRTCRCRNPGRGRGGVAPRRWWLGSPSP